MKQPTDHLDCALELLARGCTATQTAFILAACCRLEKRDATALAMDALEFALLESVYGPPAVADPNRPSRAP